MIGRRLSHYQVIERLGAGGMGEVYRARDERLERDVALKILPDDLLTDEAARRRFRKEALALSRLNHPNIQTVHDFDTAEGVTFLVTEYVPGVTLDDRLTAGPLSERDVARLGVQLAEGLAAAHEQGIVHRDLKPSNLRLTPDGRLKILDFGIAKKLDRPGDAATTESVAATHGVIGTLPYMSPEQLRAEEVDARTDIYSAGAVLYEMATGRRPFEKRVPTALADSILHEAPVSPARLNSELSARLDEVILKCLEKDPENRYQSARELVVDLRRLGFSASVSGIAIPAARPRRRRRVGWIVGAAVALLVLVVAAIWLGRSNLARTLWTPSAVAPTAIRSLAVLPLENLSGDPGQEYFADGMTEELITELSQISALKVISRTSVMQYKSVKKPLPEIARELGVDAVVEGSVLKAGGRVRITAQLIEAATDRSLWAQSYDRDLRDVLALQADVARQVAREIQVRLTPDERARLTTVRSVDPAAHEAYLKGRFHWNQRTRDAVGQSLQDFQRALAVDPTYALGYVGVADAFVVLGANTWLPAAEAFPKARQAALKALELNDALAEPHADLGFIAQSGWDWPQAEKQYQRALALNPSYAVAHQWYSYFLSARGHHQEAVLEARRAVELDPLSAVINVNLAQVLYTARRYDEARQQAHKTLDIAPDFFPALYYLGLTDVRQGAIGKGLAELEKAAALSSRDSTVLAALGYADGVAGKPDQAAQILAALVARSKQEYVSPYSLALVCVGLGRKDEALSWLEKAYQDHDAQLLFVGVEPGLEPLHDEARFQSLLTRMGFHG